jgi:hypothetical protein
MYDIGQVYDFHQAIRDEWEGKIDPFTRKPYSTHFIGAMTEHEPRLAVRFNDPAKQGAGIDDFLAVGLKPGDCVSVRETGTFDTSRNWAVGIVKL